MIGLGIVDINKQTVYFDLNTFYCIVSFYAINNASDGIIAKSPLLSSETSSKFSSE